MLFVVSFLLWIVWGEAANQQFESQDHHVETTYAKVRKRVAESMTVIVKIIYVQE
jgi:hypothetical protein